MWCRSHFLLPCATRCFQGQDYVGEVDRRRWAYMFIALPDNLYSFALIQCGQMDDPNGGALGTSKLLMDTIFNCRNEESCV